MLEPSTMRLRLGIHVRRCARMDAGVKNRPWWRVSALQGPESFAYPPVGLLAAFPGFLLVGLCDCLSTLSMFLQMASLSMLGSSLGGLSFTGAARRSRTPASSSHPC